MNKYFSICIKKYDLFNKIKILDEKGIVTHNAPFDKQPIGLDQFRGVKIFSRMDAVSPMNYMFEIFLDSD